MMYPSPSFINYPKWGQWTLMSSRSSYKKVLTLSVVGFSYIFAKYLVIFSLFAAVLKKYLFGFFKSVNAFFTKRLSNFR